MNLGPFNEKKMKKKSHNAEKTENPTFWDVSTSILSESIKKLKAGPLMNFFEKSLTEPKNTLREYPLAPLSFLDDVKLLRKLSKNCDKL